MNFWEAGLIERVLEIAADAAQEILAVYQNNDLAVKTKSDNSPVTEADLRAESVIRRHLAQDFPYPIVSEETVVPDSERTGWREHWLVDPLDGTKNFIAGDGEFTVNIALIREGRPVLGVVHLPATGEAFFATAGGGAYRLFQGKREMIFNDRTTSEWICAVSRFHNSSETEQFCARFGITQTQPYGSSLKICRLAQGLLDVYPRLAPTKEWDIAAAHCVANEAGCKVVDLSSGRALRYGKESLLNNHFVASRGDLDFTE